MPPAPTVILLTESVTVFDLHGTERLAKWKKIREDLESSENPFQIVADTWSRAPFVNPYLDPKNPIKWPDPWHLILDDRYDDLAIALGMLYTLKLTQRFMNLYCEIHMSMSAANNDKMFFLVADNKYVLNLFPKEVLKLNDIKERSDKIWSGAKLP